MWAQKQIYSRPSIAANVGVTVQENVVPVKTSSTTDISSNIGGKWAEVSTLYKDMYCSIVYRELLMKLCWMREWPHLGQVRCHYYII